jgi:hypothetical protein
LPRQGNQGNARYLTNKQGYHVQALFPLQLSSHLSLALTLVRREARAGHGSARKAPGEDILPNSDALRSPPGTSLQICMSIHQHYSSSTITVASQITSYLSTTPLTLRLEVPSEIQQTSDFASDQTTASAEQELTLASFESTNWGCI